ncbi:hypothetical protein RRG08_060908 [Elysia crispata]|uniref:Uncharacterized protein n=1 Tax=Elysia crispata TaxID=231223 RepID=A0AAE1D9H3_9GAST|nr:hypothetical protein RRG08_060908 [Elysia crispata]
MLKTRLKSVTSTAQSLTTSESAVGDGYLHRFVSSVSSELTVVHGLGVIAATSRSPLQLNLELSSPEITL